LGHIAPEKGPVGSSPRLFWTGRKARKKSDLLRDKQGSSPKRLSRTKFADMSQSRLFYTDYEQYTFVVSPPTA